MARAPGAREPRSLIHVGGSCPDHEPPRVRQLLDTPGADGMSEGLRLARLLHKAIRMRRNDRNVSSGRRRDRGGRSSVGAVGAVVAMAAVLLAGACSSASGEASADDLAL